MIVTLLTFAGASPVAAGSAANAAEMEMRLHIVVMKIVGPMFMPQF